MSYVKHAAMGTSIADIATIGTSVATSPNFATLLSLVKQVQALPSYGGGGSSTPETAAQTAADINADLGEAIPWVRRYIYVRQNPWVIPVGVAAAVAVPVLIGFLLGRSGK